MKKQLLLVVSMMILAFTSTAQYYQINASGGNPKGLNKDNEFPPGGGLASDWVTLITGTTSTTSSWSADQAMPFNFSLDGTPVSTYRVSSSGVINFSATAPASPAYGTVELSASSVPNSSLCVLGLGTTTTTDYVVKKVFGNAPNRQLWIQFNSCTEPNLINGWVYFSIVLEETTNNIYFVDQRTQCLNGQTACTNKTKLSVGVKIDGSTSYSVEGSPNFACTSLNDPTPADNSYIMFLPGVQPANDINLISLDVPKYGEKNSDITIKGKLSNYGSTNLTSFKINYSVNNGDVKTMNIIGVDITKNGGTFDFTHNFPFTPTSAGLANLRVWVTDPNGTTDPIPSNNELSSTITILDKLVPRRTLHEVFTSSTCPPCKPGNEQLTAVLNERVGKWAVLKYQYYFPGTGDPYFTQEALNRGTYYGGVNSVPALFVDGGWNDNPNGYEEAIFDQFQSMPSLVQMTTSLNVTGNKADVTVNVTPVAEMPTGNYKLRVALVERETSKNVKTNGETEFHFVMKKMLPNETGSSFTFPAKDVAKTTNLSYSFPGTFRLPASATKSASVAPTGTNYNGIDIATENTVEEFYDLAVVAFIQNDDTKEILQSSWTVQDWAIGMKENVKNASDFNVYPNPATNDLVIEWNGSKDAKFRMLDLNGKEVMSEMSINSSINIENLNTGIYVIEMVEAGKTITKKVSIIR
ncbi:MAG: T9SS type A sorting domain-containing protein [Bacteroidia bacterium]|nr:T9SS type A sorting domain-containing protein [Bacteroidia bacterium]